MVQLLVVIETLICLQAPYGPVIGCNEQVNKPPGSL
jgi:hypothetical protein